jgi:hypothetical protein
MTKRILSFALVLFAVLAVKAAVPEGRIVYWPMNAIVDGRTLDEANANHLTVIGTPTVEPALVGNGLTFALTTQTYLTNRHDSADVANSLPVIPGTAYTMAFWIKAPAQTNRYIFAHGSGTDNDPLLILQSGNATGVNSTKLDVIIRNDTGGVQINHLVSSAAVFDGAWHHVVWVDDFGQVRLYIDGQLDSANFNYTPTGTYTYNSTAIGTLVRAAIAGTGNSLIGTLDEFSIWKRALTAEEAASVVAPQMPLTITSSPVSQTRNQGDWVRFTVGHTGTGPLTYQWYSNNVPVLEGTNRTLLVTGLTTADTGDSFYVAITNSLGGVVSTSATVTVNADAAPDVRNGLVNYWPLDTIEQVGVDLISPDLYSGNGMVLVNFAGVDDKVEGKFGSALFFDSSLSKYSYRSNGSPAAGSSNFTVSLWVKADYIGQNDRRVFSEGSSSTDNPLFTIGTQGVNPPNAPVASVLMRPDTGGAVLSRTTTRPVFNDQWHHIVWSDSNGDARFYVDGVLDETDFRYTRGALTLLNRTSLGAVLRAAVGNYYFGNIDDVAVWRRALNATEVNQIMTSGVPPPISIIAPSIATQPLSRTNEVYFGDTVEFSVQVTGTEPITYEWYRVAGGTTNLITEASNSTAITSTLVVTNVQAGDSGASFFVKATNSAGSATSNPAALEIAGPPPILRVDVGLTGNVNLQPGFSLFTLAENPATFGDITMTVSPLGETTVLADRNRATPGNNPPLMTQAQIYQDFIFANNTNDGTGLRINFTGLTPSTRYEVTIWSFDSGSGGTRFSDWMETSNPDSTNVIQNQYTFDGNVLPTQNYQRTMRAILTTTASGGLQIDAIKNGGAGFGAFFNGIRITPAPPAPTEIRIVSVAHQGANLVFTLQTNSGNASPVIQQRADVAAGIWSPTPNTTVVQNENGTIIIQAPFDPATPQMFYRAALP